MPTSGHGFIDPQDPSQQGNRAAHLCDELNRVLRGHNGTPGLLTQVALLNDQTNRLAAMLDEHIREHKTDREKRRSEQMRIIERVVLWILVAVLSMTLADNRIGALEKIAHVVGITQPTARP